MRTHVSNRPIDAIRPAPPIAPDDAYPLKPYGFWYSVDGDWEDWCQHDWRSRWHEYTVQYDVILDGERILYIHTPDALDRFHCEYATRQTKWDAPDWNRLRAEGWDGIEIAPYRHEFRHSLMWYYGWDCASGVVWTPRGMRLVNARPILHTAIEQEESHDEV